MEKTVMNFEDLANYTGLSKSYLYKLTSTGILPHSKPFGKCLFFDKAEIDSFLLSNKVATVNEIDSRAANFVTLKNVTK